MSDLRLTAAEMLAEHTGNLDWLDPDVHARSEEVRRMIMAARFDRAEEIVDDLCPLEYVERRARLISIAEQAVREHRDVTDAVLCAIALYQLGIEPQVDA